MIYKLSDLCDYVKEKIDVKELTPKNYISTENMLPNKRGISIASSIPSILQTQAFKKGDILISNIRPYFKKIWYAEYDGGCSNDVLVLRAKKGVNKQYLYYLLADDRFFDYAMAFSKGTKMPRGDKTAIMNYSVISFSNEKQDNIAEILNVLDKKIFINDKINRNLQEQAKAIFEQELLKVEKIPPSWKKGSLIDIAEFLNGLAMQKFRPGDGEIAIPVLKIKELRQGSCDSSSDVCSSKIKSEYIIHDGDVIFSWSGSLLVDFWCGGECGLNQHLFKVSSKKFDRWFYYAWTLYHLDRFIAVASDKATTMGHIKRDELSKAEVLIPDELDYRRIGKMLEPIYDMIISNRIANRKLAILRDQLIPNLMSGKIDVSDIEK